MPAGLSEEARAQREEQEKFRQLIIENKRLYEEKVRNMV